MDERIIKYLDEMESNKNEIDITDVDINIDDEREIISFKIVENSTFELGESRFFSDTIDVAESVELPLGLDFVGQVNLSDVSKYDNKGLLPKDGMLYFFQSSFDQINGKFYEFGKVIYSNDMNLVRKQIEVTDNNKHMMLNFSMNDISNEKEYFSKRYKMYDGELEYSSFAGEELNKIYGFYTDCQMDEEEIKQVSKKYIVLLQLGCDVYGEGVTTFLITEEDLRNRNFDKVIFTYVQS